MYSSVELSYVVLPLLTFVNFFNSIFLIFLSQSNFCKYVLFLRLQQIGMTFDLTAPQYLFIEFYILAKFTSCVPKANKYMCVAIYNVLKLIFYCFFYRVHLTLTQSRRRMNWNVLQNPTVNFFMFYYGVEVNKLSSNIIRFSFYSLSRFLNILNLVIS